MSSTAPVELDFLGIRGAAAGDHRDNANTASSSSSSSIRGMRTSAIASIGTRQLLRVIAGGSAEPPAGPAPTMTVFYNGAVATFRDVSRDQAEAVMQMAAEAVVSGDKARGRGDTLVGNLAKDTPPTRTRSLQQFLQKRKERLARVGPYQPDAASRFFTVKEEAT